MSNYDWLDKKTPRTVENLKLWPDNPRLNPEERHIRVSDFADDLISDDSDKTAFLNLVKSIANDGFRPYDPIIVWKNESDGNFYVAEGNRRVLALKLLLDPSKAPKSIRSTIRKHSDKIDVESIKKIRVNVAPDFEEAEWYINQRNNASSLHRTWTRTQQQRWILELYDKYGGDISVVAAKTNFTPSELESYIRPLKIRDFVFDEEMKKHLTIDEIAEAKSIKFPITILERFFSKQEARDKFKIEYDGINIKLNGDRESFFIAFAELIERIIKRETTYKNSPTKIDTRTLTTNFDAILDSLPDVEDENPDAKPTEPEPEPQPEPNPEPQPTDGAGGTSPTPPPPLKNNPNRPYLVLSIYTLRTDKTRLLGIFREFKSVPLSRYPHTIASALRVFLDLAVLEYIQTENLTDVIAAQYRADFKEVPLKKRLEYLKANSSKQAIKNKINTLLTSGQQFSIDVLNGFIHGQATHYIDKQFLNKFWDFLFPLFEELLDIEEN
jgi:ParB-like chromosome segregation protein Spo0J